MAAIGLQEVALLTPGGALNDQPAELARLTGLEVRYAAVHAYQLVEPEDGRAIGVATWGNAILGRVALERGFAIGLPGGADDTLVESPDAHLPLAGVRYRDAEPGAREPRCVVGGAMTLGGVRTWVLTTHFAYAGRDQRRAQAAAVLDCIAGLEGPVVLLGDLNAPSEDPELADLRASLTDAFDAVGVAAGDERRRSTANARIDHVFVRGLRVIDCRVDPGPGDASDHLPVVATLSTV